MDSLQSGCKESLHNEIIVTSLKSFFHSITILLHSFVFLPVTDLLGEIWSFVLQNVLHPDLADCFLMVWPTCLLYCLHFLTLAIRSRGFSRFNSGSSWWGEEEQQEHLGCMLPTTANQEGHTGFRWCQSNP